MPIKFSMSMKGPKKTKPGSGDIEADCKEELSELQKGFRERTKREADRKESVTDSEYWVCLCFQNREQAEAFLKASRMGAADAKYIDGRKVADALGIELPEGAKFPKAQAHNHRLVNLAKEIESHA